MEAAVSLQIDDTVAEGITAPNAVAVRRQRGATDVRPGMRVNVQMPAEPEQSMILEISTPTQAVAERRQLSERNNEVPRPAQ